MTTMTPHERNQRLDEQARRALLDELILPIAINNDDLWRKRLMQAVEDSASGDVDAFFALHWLGRSLLVITGESEIAQPEMTEAYIDTLYQLIAERRYSEIVPPDQTHDVSDAWRSAFETRQRRKKHP